MRLEFAGVSQGYGSADVFQNLDLQLNNGVIGLVGPNGAGKSTLLRTMATVMPPRQGEVIINGVRVTGERHARTVRRGIGYLPQDFGFDRGMKVMDFVVYGAWARGVPSRDWSATARAALARVDLKEKARTKMRALSGGMRQRAGIAWAIVGEPSIVLLDEPTSGLDPQQRLHFRAIIRQLTDTTVVLSTHMIDDVAAICDKVVAVHSGAIRFYGTVDELAKLGSADLPGDSELERAYMSLLPDGERTL